MAKITLLGTGTCQLQPARRASSVLVEVDDLRLVYDMGRGIADRLSALGLRQDDVEHVVISHFHPDHVSDLVPFLHAASWSQVDPRTVDLNLYGPPGTETLVAGMMELYGAGALGRETWNLNVHEIDDQGFSVAGRSVDFVDLPPAGNRGLGLTVGESRLVLTGDSGFHPQEVEFLRGVDLAIFDSGHLTDAEIVDLAAATGGALMVASHVYRPLDIPELQRRAEEQGFRGRLLLGEDLMTFTL